MKKGIIIFFIAAFFLVSCSVNEEEMAALTESSIPQVEVNKPTGTVTPQVEENTDTVTLSMRPPKTLNPILNEDETVDKVLSLVFKPLFQIDIDQKVVPVIAKSYVLSSDGLTLSITLNEDVKFSDGVVLTASDVIFTLESIKNAEGSYYKSALDGIESYSAADKDTVIIKYEKPLGSCMYNLCFPIIPEHYYSGKMSVESDVSMKPLGDGDFVFKSYRIVRELDLVRNGDGGIKNIKVIISPDSETDMDLFEQGITDVIWLTASEWGKLNTKREVNTVTESENNFEFLGLNLKSEIFQNINLRKAIACAVPSNEIVDNIYLGNAEKCVTPINPNSWLYCSDSKISYEYNIEQAVQYLKETGFSTEQLKFNLIVNEENNERNETAKIIASSLNQLGMEVNVVSLPYESYIQELNNDNFDMFIAGARFSYIPDLSCFLSSAARIEPGINYMNYSDSTMDALLERAKSSIGESEYKIASDEIQKLFFQQLPCIGIVFKDSILAADAKIKNCSDFMPYNYLSGISQWYISNE